MTSQLMTQKQLAEYLQVSARVIRKHSKIQGFPVVRIGRAVRYDPEAVLAWYATNPPQEIKYQLRRTGEK